MVDDSGGEKEGGKNLPAVGGSGLVLARSRALSRAVRVALGGRGLVEVEDDAWVRELGDLDLSFCRLSGLPSAIGGLLKLERLDLEGNRLASLPESFARLTNLEELVIRGNFMGELPAHCAHLRGRVVDEISSFPLFYF